MNNIVIYFSIFFVFGYVDVISMYLDAVELISKKDILNLGYKIESIPDVSR